MFFLASKLTTSSNLTLPPRNSVNGAVLDSRGRQDLGFVVALEPIYSSVCCRITRSRLDTRSFAAHLIV